MKVILALCALGFIFGLILINSAYGQIYSGHSSFPEVQLQVEHRNADGHLLGYYESRLAYFTNVFLLNEYLDTLDVKDIIEKDGQTLEIFIIHKKAVFTENFNGQFTTFDIIYKEYRPLEFRHDGFFGEAGDSVSATFKIVRLV